MNILRKIGKIRMSFLSAGIRQDLLDSRGNLGRVSPQMLLLKIDAL
jgi:hypothetical protein